MTGPSDARSGTVTFLFTDIEGSTRLLQQAGAGYGDLLDAHRRLLREAFDAHRGREVDTQGDSFFVVFANATDAVAAAVDAQRALAAHDWPDGRAVRVRMGVHTGEATAVGNGFVGLDVHRGARVGAAAHGGQVLLSEATAVLVRDALPAGVSLRDLGEHHLKDLEHGERLHQLDVEGLPSEFAAPASLRAPSRLPARLGRFIGRERETEAVARLLTDPEVRLVTLAGPGGMGKTSLALEVAARVERDFADGAVAVLLAPVRDPDLVPLAVRQALGITETAGREHLDVVVEYLRTRDLLLVLDNFEHVIPAAPVVAELLERTERVTVLVTSREVLRVSGEHEFDVPPLAVPEGVRLFLDRAHAVHAGFALTEDNTDAVTEITRHLDGLPLAIELAAARVRVMPPETILRRLGSRFQLLTGGPRDAPERHRTLRDTIAWSYDLLDDHDRLLLDRLAVFPGSFDLDAAEAVAGDDEVVVDVLSGLTSLVDKSLLRPVAGARGDARFSFLETVREYAAERLGGLGDVDRLRRRHADVFLGLVEEATPWMRSRDQDVWYERLRDERDNLRAAMRWRLVHGEAGVVARMGWGLWPFWWVENNMLEGAAWMEEVLAAPADAVTDEERAFAASVYGTLSFGWGDYVHAVPVLHDAEAMCRATGNPFGRGMALSLLAVVDAVQGAPDVAEREIADAVEAFDAADDRWGVAFADYCLSRVLLLHGRHKEAEAVSGRGVAAARALGEKIILALSLLNLGWARIRTADIPGATEALRESLDLLQAMANAVDSARAMEALAACAVEARDPDLGAVLFGAADGLRRTIGASVWVPDRQTHDATDAALRRALGEDGYEVRFREGCGLTVRDAVALIGTPSGVARDAGG
jgi:predicted ATPase/class 3 adenylate cyclase